MDVKSGFVVRMHFAENPFFSNSVLEKKIDYLEDGTVKLSSVPPQWLPGKVGTPLLICFSSSGIICRPARVSLWP